LGTPPAVHVILVLKTFDNFAWNRPPWLVGALHRRKTKKAGVAEHLRVFDHVGLLVNQPPSTNRAAFVQVVRRHREAAALRAALPDAFDNIAQGP
jgi:hypothetical protein